MRLACWLRGPAATIFLKAQYAARCVAVRKVRDGEDAIANTRDACATQRSREQLLLIRSRDEPYRDMVKRILLSALRITIAVAAVLTLFWWFGIRMPSKNISKAAPLSS